MGGSGSERVAVPSALRDALDRGIDCRRKLADTSLSPTPPRPHASCAAAAGESEASPTCSELPSVVVQAEQVRVRADTRRGPTEEVEHV